MTRDEAPRGEPHPEPEELEAHALGGAAGSAVRRHVEECGRCRREAEALRGLHAALASLPILGPSPGFAVRVMARVHLPVPWHVQVQTALRRRWLLLSATLATVGASVGGLSVWLGQHPGLTPLDFGAFVHQQVREAFWRGAIAVWQALAGTGLLDAAARLARDLTLGDAVAGLATVSVVGMAGVAGLVRLMRRPAGGLAPAPRG